MNFINSLLDHIVLSSAVVVTSTACKMTDVNKNAVLEYFTYFQYLGLSIESEVQTHALARLNLTLARFKGIT